MNDHRDVPGGGDGAETWFRVELHSHGHTCTLVLHGELCGTSIAALEAQVDQLGCLPSDNVVVDLRQLTALDLVGAKVLLGLHHYVDGRGGQLRITGAIGEISDTLHRYAFEYSEADVHLTSVLDGSSSAAEASATHPSDASPGSAGRGGRCPLRPKPALSLRALFRRHGSRRRVPGAYDVPG